jgi:hypothetical protein
VKARAGRGAGTIGGTFRGQSGDAFRTPAGTRRGAGAGGFIKRVPTGLELRRLGSDALAAEFAVDHVHHAARSPSEHTCHIRHIAT